MARTPEAPTGATPDASSSKDGKGRPTPSRKEKEEARKRPLVVNDRAERRRREREASAIQREKARVGMANGEERYLPVRDRGVQRRFIRDYIDARWSVGELILPTIALYLVSSLVPLDVVAFAGLGLIWFIFTASIIDFIVLIIGLKRRLVEKFGAPEKGYRFYAAIRTMYFRQLRMPKPQVKRGEYPE